MSLSASEVCMSARLFIWCTVLTAALFMGFSILTANQPLAIASAVIAVLVLPFAAFTAIVSTIRWILTGRSDGTLASRDHAAPRRDASNTLKVFLVRGADRETGRESSVKVRAATARDAADQASDCGILVSDVLRES